MIRQFAKRSPKAASRVIYAAGYAAGALWFLVGYLISGVRKMARWRSGRAAEL
jgi:hypothetical protein